MENKIFDVAEVSSPSMLAVRIRTTIKNTQKIMLDAAISVGSDLIQAKKLVAEGEWEEWVEQATEMTSSSARKYMQIAREYGDESKRELIPALSYTKALKLLAVPEEDREEFLENNDVEGMTVKQLAEKVKELEDVNSSTEAKAKKLEEDLQKAETELDSYSQREKDLVDQINGLKEKDDATEGISEEAQAEIDKIRMEKLEEIKTIAKEKEDIIKKADKLKDQLDKIKIDQEKKIAEEREKAIAEGKAEGKKESEEEIQKLLEITERANEAKQEAEKKLAAAADEDAVMLKVIAESIKKSLTEAGGVIQKIRQTDEDRADRVTSLIKKLVAEALEEL